MLPAPSPARRFSRYNGRTHLRLGEEPVSRPASASFIERRLLVNFRLDPETTARILPEGTRPLLRRGHAVGGICLIRLAGARRSGGPLPGLADLAGRFGLRAEIAVHRIA